MGTLPFRHNYLIIDRRLICIRFDFLTYSLRINNDCSIALIFQAGIIIYIQQLFSGSNKQYFIIPYFLST